MGVQVSILNYLLKKLGMDGGKGVPLLTESARAGG